MPIRYRGFSTIGQTKKYRLTDLELIKRDLLNHFAIRKGEKLMDPNFGSIIWNMIFEPLLKPQLWQISSALSHTIHVYKSTEF
jgi:phage baseplate assembly protein W